MKKNLITVIILALVLANLILTAILVFTIIPQTKKSNQLIDQVCSAINLELQSGGKIRRLHRRCRSKMLRLMRSPMDLP